MAGVIAHWLGSGTSQTRQAALDIFMPLVQTGVDRSDLGFTISSQGAQSGIAQNATGVWDITVADCVARYNSQGLIEMLGATGSKSTVSGTIDTPLATTGAVSRMDFYRHDRSLIIRIAHATNTAAGCFRYNGSSARHNGVNVCGLGMFNTLSGNSSEQMGGTKHMSYFAATTAITSATVLQVILDSSVLASGAVYDPDSATSIRAVVPLRAQDQWGTVEDDSQAIVYGAFTGVNGDMITDGTHTWYYICPWQNGTGSLWGKLS